MDLPTSVLSLGEQLSRTGELTPDPELFSSDDVFAAERERIFALPWVAADHASRIVESERFFRFDMPGRSILVTRGQDGGLHALRNLCLHAGYAICDAEEGSGERLICPYHGWEYTLEGRLVEPNLSSRIDPARLQLPRYPVCVRGGLIFVDLSGKSPEPEAAAAPEWIAQAQVRRRARYSTTANWKRVLQLLDSAPQIFLDEPEHRLAFGPLSLMLVNGKRAALVRVIPRTIEKTELHLIELGREADPEPAPPAEGEDRIAAELRRRDEGEPAAPDRRFLEWYWSLMSRG
jgi:nitrite reductase/ring-hydroxylating ferredoxin subunit